MQTKKINNKVVKAIPVDESKKDKRPLKGIEVCPKDYANIGLFARKGMGKTSVIYSLIEQCMGRDTSVIAFVSTLHQDAQWTVIRNYCEKKGNPFIGFTSLMEDGANQLEAFINLLQNPNPVEETKEVASDLLVFPCAPAPTGETKGEAEVKPLRKTKYQAPEYIIILDDLSTELKMKVVPALLKKNRHFKCKVIISTQWPNDLAPESIKQLNLLMLFKGLPLPKLEELHEKCAIPVPLELFEKMYHQATEPDYGFLWIDLDKYTYRMNFGREFDL